MNETIRAWQALPAPAGALRAVLVDVDGCLTAGEGQPLDLAALAACAAINERARRDALTPAITLCTGRPAPYVEVLLQAIAGFLPALAEHGGVLLSPADYHIQRHQLIESAGATLDALRAAVGASLVRPGLGFLQPGKETMLTFYPAPGVTFERAMEVGRAAGASYAELFGVEFNRTCIEWKRHGVDKGSGVRWLADLLDLPLGALAGIGDSDSDLAFLTLVGFPAAPANAIAPVRAQSAYIATRPDARGVLEIVELIEARNRALTRT
jgi:HAD superfamily hydrolase (TIGR01484 family)